MGRPKISELTDADRDALAFILRYTHDHGREPTLTAVGKHLGLGTPTNSRLNVARLVAHGKLEEGEGRARPFKVPGLKTGFTLPVVGVTAAGPPIASEAFDDRFSFQETFGRPDYFMLRVRGDSMIGAQIRDRDLVVLRPAPAGDPKTGAVGVFRVKGGHTLKRYRRGDGWESWLEAENPDVPPIEAPYGADPVGLLVGVVRVGIR